MSDRRAIVREIQRRIRERQGTRTLHACGIQARIPESTFRRIAHGGLPDLVTLLALCRWLRCSADDLLGVRGRRPLMEERNDRDE